MHLNKDYKISEKILRIGLSVVIIWFGISQLINRQIWIGDLPASAFDLSFISTINLVYINGIFETLFGILLLLNQCSKVVSTILAIHMLTIIMHLGYNEIAIRDFAICIGFISLIFSSENKYFFKKK